MAYSRDIEDKVLKANTCALDSEHDPITSASPRPLPDRKDDYQNRFKARVSSERIADPKWLTQALFKIMKKHNFKARRGNKISQAVHFSPATSPSEREYPLVEGHSSYWHPLLLS